MARPGADALFCVIGIALGGCIAQEGELPWSWGALRYFVTLCPQSDHICYQGGTVVLADVETAPPDLVSCCRWGSDCWEALPTVGEWTESLPLITAEAYAALDTVGGGWRLDTPENMSHDVDELGRRCVALPDPGPEPIEAADTYTSWFPSMADYGYGIGGTGTDPDDFAWTQLVDPLRIVGINVLGVPGAVHDLTDHAPIPNELTGASISVRSAAGEVPADCWNSYPPTETCDAVLGPEDSLVLRWDAASDPVDADGTVTARVWYYDDASPPEVTREAARGLSLGGEAVLPAREIALDWTFGRVFVDLGRSRSDAVTIGGVHYDLQGSVRTDGWAAWMVDLTGYDALPAARVGEDCGSATTLVPVGPGPWTGSLVGHTSEHSDGYRASGSDLAVAVDVAEAAPLTLTYLLPLEEGALTVWDAHCSVVVEGPKSGRGELGIELATPGRYIAVLDSSELYDVAWKRPPGMPFTWTVAATEP